MPISKKQWTYLCVGVVLTFIPYILLCFANHPSADDFSYGVGFLRHGFWSGQIWFYNHENGRYMATFLIGLNPLSWGWIHGYKYVSLILILSFLMVTFLFIRHFSIRFLKLRASHQIFLSLCFSGLYLTNMPSVAQGLYWSSGSMTYMVPTLFSLLAMIFLSNWRRATSALYWVYAFFVTLLTIMLIGGNETSMLFWMLGLSALVAFYLGFLSKLFAFLSPQPLDTGRWLSLGLVWISGFMASLVVILAPGTKMRSAYFEDTRHQLFRSLYKTIFTAIDHNVNFLSLPLIVFLLLMTSSILKNKDQFPDWFSLPKIRKTGTWMIFLITCIGLFPGHWAMGGSPPPRTDNVTYFYWLVSVLMVYSFWVLAKQDWFQEKLQAKVWWLNPQYLAPLFLLTLFTWRNNGRAFYDLTKAQEYNQHYMQRYEGAQNHQGDIFEVRHFPNPPLTLFFTDYPVTKDPIQGAFADYLGVKAIQVTDHK